MSSSGEGDFDSVFHALGWRGIYQVTELILLFYNAVPFAFIVMSIVFTGHSIPAKCKEVNNTSMFFKYGITEDLTGMNISYEQCSILISGNLSDGRVELPCINGYEYEQDRKFSLVSEWDLVCDKDSLSDLLQTVQMFGMATGAFSFTVLSDKRGRKFVYCLCGVIILIVSISMTFVPTYVPFAVLKFVQGSTLAGCALSASTQVIEMVPTDKRSVVTAYGGLFWSFTLVLYAVAAYLMKELSWRHHQLVCGLTASAFVLIPWFLDESSRWLAAKRKYESIERNLKKAARKNGKDERSIIQLFRKKVLAVYVTKYSLSTFSEPKSELTSQDQTAGCGATTLNDNLADQQFLVDKNDQKKQLLRNEHGDEGERQVPENVEKEMLLESDSDGAIKRLPENRNEHEHQLLGRKVNGKESRTSIAISNVHNDEHGLLAEDIAVDTGTTEEEKVKVAQESEGSVIDIFKDRHIFFVSAIVWFVWLTDTLNYYGLNLTSTEIHSNKYIGFGLNALVEVPSVIAFILTVDRFGRKKSVIAAHFMAGLCLILSVVCDNFKGSLPSLSIGVTVFSLLGKFAVSTAFSIIWMYTPELYPTTMRNIGYGMASMISRIGGILAPFSRTLYRHYPWAPGSVFGSMNVIAGLLVFFLPETAGQELPQTVQEMKQWLKKDRRGKNKDKHSLT